jgi:hypothetical protein
VTTTNLTEYAPRINALCRTSGGRVNVEMNLWYRATTSHPDMEWTVYVSEGSENGTHLFHGATLDQALTNAEYACGMRMDVPDMVIL